MTTNIIAGVIVGVGLIGILIIVGIYKSLVTQRNLFKNGFAQIDVQLKRRNDLISSIVEAVKGNMKHEEGVLEEVTKAHNVAAADPTSTSAIQGLLGAETTLDASMCRLLATFEAYPTSRPTRTLCHSRRD